MIATSMLTRSSAGLRRAALGLVVLGALLAPGAASADTPRNAMIEIHVGPYLPQIDAQFAAAQPYKDVFGDADMLLFRLHFDYQFWQGHGALAAGVGLGYGWVDGAALDGSGTGTEDEVGFNLLPVNATLSYRWDWAAIHHAMPLVPYVKVGLTGAVWWATNAKDEIANARGPDGEGRSGSGVTFGWHAGGGLQFLLDVLGPGMASEFDNEVGVNNSYLFFEFLYTQLNDFGAEDSIDLSDATFSGGLMFEF